MLRCRDGSLYTGATNDLPRRLLRHAAGNGARYTRSRLPVTLVYQERAKDRSGALRREAALKRLARAEKLALIDRLPPRRRTCRVGSGRPTASLPRGTVRRSHRSRGSG